MSKGGYIALAVALTVVLLALFIVSFLLYVRQPAPKGCENLGRDMSQCGSCEESSCRFYRKAEELSQKEREEKEAKQKASTSPSEEDEPKQGQKPTDGDSIGKEE